MERLLSDRVMIEPDPERKEIVSSSGIIMPIKKDERYHTGTVVKCGKKCLYLDDVHETMVDFADVKEGDRFLFGKFTGSVYYEGDKKYLIMRYADLILKIETEKKDLHYIAE